MSNDNKTIHEFDFNLICEYFSLIERQGPGSTQVTVKALSFIDNLNSNSIIIDLGCGTGGQTISIAKNAPGIITAVDLFPGFIDKLNQNIISNGLQSRIKGVVGSMDNIMYNANQVDLIWSEGAIYNIGFENGLNLWHKYLKKGGYVAVSEVSWFTQTRPTAIEEYWLNAYNQIDTIDNKVKQMQNAGYVPVATFILPENCWTDNFYTPQQKAREFFLNKYAGNQAAINLVNAEIYESEMYNKYKDFYGYVFYIGKKI